MLAENELRGYELIHDVVTRHSFHYHDCQTTVCKAMFIYNSHEMTELLADAYQRGMRATANAIADRIRQYRLNVSQEYFKDKAFTEAEALVRSFGIELEKDD